MALPLSNHVVDDGTRTWLTASTRQQSRAPAYRSDVADGFVAVIDHSAARASSPPMVRYRAGTVTPFGHGTYPDGLACAAEGGIWIASTVSSRALRARPDGSQEMILEDCDPLPVHWVEQAFQAGEMGRPRVDKARGRFLKGITSLAFGGPGLRTAHLGCVLDDRIACFDSPVAGHPPHHWKL